MERYYFYIDKSLNQRGPFSLQQLAKEGIGSDTLVWHENLPDWQTAASIRELDELINPKVSPSAPPITPNSPSDNIKYDSLYEKVSNGAHTFKESAQPASPKRPKDWIVESILVTFLCCLPLGIVGLTFALQSSDAWRCGDYERAQKRSRHAGICVKIAFWGVIILISITLLLIVAIPSIALWFAILMQDLV